MEYPIPKTSADAFLSYQNKSPQNAGVIFDRFAPNWGSDAKIKEKGLEDVRVASEKADKLLLEAWNRRWENLVTAANAQFFEMQTDWRLIAGLGRKGSLEVGFTFHRYGFPYLPGSSIKGLTRARGLLEIASELGKENLEQLRTKVAQDEHKPPEKIGLLNALDMAISREDEKIFKDELASCQASPKVLEMAKAFRSLFGTTESAGEVVFFDAIPSPKSLPKLELDIMNPHYPDYYKDGSHEYPTNWQSPIPVKFLTVASGTIFRFAIGWRRSPQDNTANSEFHQPTWSWFKGTKENEQVAQTQARLQMLARQWLEGGLRDLGAGGKTNAGYGFFVEPGSPVFPPENSQATSQSALPTGYERGTVKDFGLGDNRSFGFIVRSNGAEIFVHKKELAAGLSNLSPGQKVIFKVGTGPKGPAAQDVRLEE